MKKFKVGVISTLIVACTGVALTGCSSLMKSSENVTTPTDESGRVTGSYGSPWVSSVVYGMVKDDTAHDKGDDWFLSVNYDYLKSEELPNGSEVSGVKAGTEEKAGKRISEIISDNNLSGNDGELIKDLYNLYTDWDNRDKAGINFIEEKVKEIDAINDLNSLSEYLASDSCKTTGVNLVGFDIDYDYEDHGYYCFVVVPTTLSLYDAAEYSSRTSYGDMMYEGLQKRVKSTLERMGYTSEESDGVLSGCIDLETSLASSMKTREFMSTNEYVDSIKHKRTAAQLATESGSFPLGKILDTWGLSESQRNYLLEPDWLKCLNENYTEANLSKMKDYLKVGIIQKYAGLSDKESFAGFLESYGTEFKEDGDSTEQYADNYIKNTLTTPLGKLYAERYASAEMKSDVENLCQSIISSYKDIINANTSLSDTAKETALKKLDALNVHALYPNKWEDFSSLNIKSAAEGGSLIDAVTQIEAFNWQLQQNKLGKETDKDLWDVDITQAKVTYWPTSNTIDVFAGITDSDYYGKDMSREEKLAGVGMLIAHEINHAIDPTGSVYDEFGRTFSWWNSDDVKNYDNTKERLANYYSTFKPFKNDTAYNGERIAGEACAEIAGMQAVLGVAGKEGLNLEEIFRYYARVNEEIMTEKHMEVEGLNYKEPLSFLKVNATVKQFGEFFNAVDITEGATMYTSEQDRIIIW